MMCANITPHFPQFFKCFFLQVVPASLTLDMAPLSDSVYNMSKYTQDTLAYTSGRQYSSVCHRPSLDMPNKSTTDMTACFSAVTGTPRSLTQTLAFKPGSRDDFVAAVTRFFKSAVDGSDVRFEFESREQETIGDMKSSKWVAYAMRAFVVRFWDLAKVG